uniref:Fibronectin type III-like domain-containing protein n=1 Tax=Aplanochytrium stocchinoi TaxID=215587 RepID=A0A7S3PJ48_9STRA
MENDHNGNTRFNFDAKVSAYDLAATYMSPWEKAIKESNPLGIMCSYNMVNGKPTCGNPESYNILKEWGYEGYITSDTDSCESIYDSKKGHGYVKTGEEATALCLQGSTDIDSGHGLLSTYNRYLESGVQNGVIDRELVDKALYNSYKMRMRLGLFDGKKTKQNAYTRISTDVVQQESHVQASLNAARKTMTLLKNDKKILPFTKGKVVAVIGESSNSGEDILGNYVGPICPGPNRKKTFNCVATIFDMVKKLNEQGTVNSISGQTLLVDNVNDVDQALDAANQADYVVLTISNAVREIGGGEAYDRMNLTVGNAQLNLIKKVLDVGKPTAIVMINGGVISLDEGIIEHQNANSILNAWMPGQHGALAVAETLFGDNNPGGKMPVTMYKNSYIHEVDFLNISMQAGPGRSYRYFTGEPIFPFGHGLSYTTFSMSIESTSSCVVNKPSDECKFRIKTTNTGHRLGDEVVMVFFKPTHVDGQQQASLAGTPVLMKQLIDFKRITLAPGSSRDLVFDVKGHQLGLIDEDGNRVLQKSAFDIIFSRGFYEEGLQIRVPIKVNTEKQHMLSPFNHKWW